MSRNFVTQHRAEHYYTPRGKFDVKDEPVTPAEDYLYDFDKSFGNEDAGSMKKSLSLSDIANLREELMSLETKSNREDVQKRYRKSTISNAALLPSKEKFVSIAEAIYHFQRDTPGRFHSTRPQVFRPKDYSGPQELTRPQSPILRARTRSRRTHILSQQQKEEMELAEIRKVKIKANPIPKSVLQPTNTLPEVPRKPSTIPKPFNLTEIQRKEIPPSPAASFKARPVPKKILEKAQVPVKPLPHITVPMSPRFHYKRSKSQNEVHDMLRANLNQAHHVQLNSGPFSFLKRDEDMKRKKEERIKQIIELERKQASQFKAQPVPEIVKKRMQTAIATSSSSTASSENKENVIKFEARPPVVLFRDPFKPILKPIQPVKPLPFALTTEKRAAERERFDKVLKEKEEEQELLRQKREKELREYEDKAVAKYRASLVHHAKPVPQFEPFIPEKSVAPITIPDTPKFIRRMKQN